MRDVAWRRRPGWWFRAHQRRGGPQQQTHGFLAIAAQRMRRRRVFGQPQAHGLDIGIRGDLLVEAVCAVGAEATVERDRQHDRQNRFGGRDGEVHGATRSGIRFS